MKVLYVILFVFIVTGIYELRFGFKIPEPTGAFSVGIQDLVLKDSSRLDGGASRRLLVRLYYPAVAATGEKASYFPSLKIRENLAELMEVPSVLVSHLKYGRTNATIGPAVADVSELPIIIFSHGMNGMRIQSTYLLEELASHGYLVASIEHNGFSIGSVFPDSTMGNFSRENVLTHSNAGREIRKIWSQDQVFVYNQLEHLNDQKLLFGEKQNFGKTGVIGHSFGGATSFYTLSLENNFAAAINLDGFYFGKDPGEKTHKPLMEIRAEPQSAEKLDEERLKTAGLTRESYNDMMFNEWEQRFSEFAQGEAYRFMFRGANHLSFTDLVLGVPFKILFMKDHDFYHSKTRILVKDFLDATIKGEPFEEYFSQARNKQPYLLIP